MKLNTHFSAILLTALIAGGLAFSAMAAWTPGGEVMGTHCNLATDKACITGWASNVFVGKIVNPLGEKSSGSETTPWQLYSVDPVLNIKGDFQEVVTLQERGILENGSTYIFAVFPLKSENLYQSFLSPGDIEKITGDPHLNNAEIRSLAIANSSVVQYQLACPNQIPGNPSFLHPDGCQPIPRSPAASMGLTPAGRNILLAFAALVILAAAGTVAYVIRHAVKRKA